jgi:hypothetical protein
MAYKFQRGEAILSGALLQEGDVEIESGFSLIIGSASMSEADLEKLDGITDGTAAASKALVLDSNKDASGVRNFSIDGVLSGSGNVWIGGNVQLDGVVDAALDVAADSVYFLDGDGLVKSESFADLMASAVAGDNGLGASAGVLSINLHGDGGIEQTSDALKIKAGGVTNDMLSGSIASSKIAELNAFDTDDLGEGSSNLYYTEARWDSKMAAADTDDLAEGASNLYFTDARARGAVSVTDAGGDGSLSYDSSTGVITFTGPSAAEVRAHLSVADSTSIDMSLTDGEFSAVAKVDDLSIEIDAAEGLRVKALGIENSMLSGAISSDKLAELNSFDTGDLAEGSNLYYTEARWDTKMAAADTGDLAEGSNLYFTDARARGAVSVTDAGGDGSLAYDSSTGVITYTGPSAAEVRAHLSVADSNSIDMAFAAGQFSADVLVDDHSIEIDATDGLRVKAAGITNDMLSGSIASSKLAELNAFDTGDLAEGSNLYFTDARAREALSIVDAGGDGSFAYDDSTGVFTYTGPSAAEVRAHFSVLDTNSIDMSVTDGQFSAALLLSGSSLEVTADGLRLAAAAAGPGLAWADGVLSVQGSSVTSVANGDPLVEGYNYFGDNVPNTTDWSVTLPASPTVGDIVHVKARDIGTHSSIEIQRAGSHLIDGETSIFLESPFAAVSLVYVASNDWRIV